MINMTGRITVSASVHQSNTATLVESTTRQSPIPHASYGDCASFSCPPPFKVTRLKSPTSYSRETSSQLGYACVRLAVLAPRASRNSLWAEVRKAVVQMGDGTEAQTASRLTWY